MGRRANREGIVTNSSDGPEPTSMPKANALGMMMRPARNATTKSAITILTVDDGMFSLSGK